MKTKLFTRICGWMAAAVLTCGLSASCNLAKTLGDLEDLVNGEAGYGWSESGNKLTCTADFVIYSWTVEWTFDGNDICTSAKSILEWSTADLANAYWDELSDEEKADATKSGKTITEDISDEYLGVDKSTIKSSFVFPEE